MCLFPFSESIIKATNDALAALTNLREGNRRKTAKQEIGGIFRPKSKKIKLCSWKHKFCCLAYKDQKRSPTTDIERESLFRAGLGFKEIEFEDAYAMQKEFQEIILENFPRLRAGGGFRFLKGMYVLCTLISIGVFKRVHFMKSTLQVLLTQPLFGHKC